MWSMWIPKENRTKHNENRGWNNEIRVFATYLGWLRSKLGRPSFGDVVVQGFVEKNQIYWGLVNWDTCRLTEPPLHGWVQLIFDLIWMRVMMPRSTEPHGRSIETIALDEHAKLKEARLIGLQSNLALGWKYWKRYWECVQKSKNVWISWENCETNSI